MSCNTNQRIKLAFSFFVYLSFLFFSLSLSRFLDNFQQHPENMEAYVTLVATDSYAAGALVLAHRLRDLGSSKEIVCLVTSNISSRVQDILSNICTLVQVDTLRSSDYENLKLLGRPELDITFTKIQLWKLTQYKKIVFLDADTYPLQNIDQLFERPSFSAAPDAGWPDCFNSGVFVAEPNDAIYHGLCQLAVDKGSFDGKCFMIYHTAG